MTSRSAPLLKRGKHPTQTGERKRKRLPEERPSADSEDQTMSRAKSSGEAVGRRMQEPSALDEEEAVRSCGWFPGQKVRGPSGYTRLDFQGPQFQFPRTERTLPWDRVIAMTNGTLGLNSGLARSAQVLKESPARV